jgi:Na+-translocating ferredoxin:NAD+ oxidoreductase RnfC subunit
MTAKVLKMPLVRKLECSECGALGEGSCNCDAPYVNAGTRAAAAIAANPQKSDRAIAAEAKVNRRTVIKARELVHSAPVGKQTTVTNVTVGKRIGRDGKTRKLPTKRAKAKPAPTLSELINAFTWKLHSFHLAYDKEVHAFITAHPEMDIKQREAINAAFYHTVEGLADLTKLLFNSSHPAQPETVKAL